MEAFDWRALRHSRERQHVETFLRLARKVHENHAHDVPGVTVTVAGNNDTVAMNLFAGAADQVHGHFSPKRKRFLRSKLEAVFPDADVASGKGELGSIFLNL